MPFGTHSWEEAHHRPPSKSKIDHGDCRLATGSSQAMTATFKRAQTLLEGICRGCTVKAIAVAVAVAKCTETLADVRYAWG